MNTVANELSKAEISQGLDSIVLDSVNANEWEQGMGADIHVSHSHVPDKIRINGGKTVWVGHGTPEHCFQTSVEDGAKGGYGHPDTWMLVQWWLQHADAMVTFWPRHQTIWQSLCDNGRKVHCVKLGVNKEFWHPIQSRGKFVGEPSLFTAENCHYIKWPLDLFIAYPLIIEKMPDIYLHCLYLPRDQHRWFFPLVNRNGAAFKSHISGSIFGKEDLRNAFCSVDYVVNLVRYGDYNRLGLEAKACGAKLITYPGNPYSDYWVKEGDQRNMAEDFIKIFSGIDTLVGEEICDIKDTAKEMIKIYESIV